MVKYEEIWQDFDEGLELNHDQTMYWRLKLRLILRLRFTFDQMRTEQAEIEIAEWNIGLHLFFQSQSQPISFQYFSHVTLPSIIVYVQIR